MPFRHRATAAFATVAALMLVPATAHAAGVTIANKAFGPADVTIAPGQSVTWSWGESSHNVHVIQGPDQFDSGFKAAGATYSRQFTTPGVYTYRCDAHPSMHGQVVVSGQSAAAAPAPGLDLAPPRLAAVSVSTLAVVRLTASEAGRLEVRIARGTRTVKRSAATLAAGANRLPLPVRALALGRYRVTITAIDAAGRRSAPVIRALMVTSAARVRRPERRPAPGAKAPPAPATAPAPPVDDHGHHSGGHP